MRLSQDTKAQKTFNIGDTNIDVDHAIHNACISINMIPHTTSNENIFHIDN